MKKVTLALGIVVLLGMLLLFFNINNNKFELSDLKGPYLGQKPPGDIPEVFAENIITKRCSLHGCPVFSPDSKEMYWGPMDREGCKEKTDEILFMKMIDQVWTKAKVVSFSSMLWDSDDPALSPDGKRLYFTTHRPPRFLSFNFSEKIMYVDRKGDGWSSAKSVGSKVNSMFRHWQVSITGNYDLYFHADQKNVSEPGIYVSRYVDGDYQTPQRLPDEINKGNPYHPYIAADESYLIFVRTLKNRGDDLFISYKDSNGKWTEAKNLGDKINSPYHDFCPNVTPDGNYLFFISQRHGGNKAYWVDAKIIEELKPKDLE